MRERLLPAEREALDMFAAEARGDYREARAAARRAARYAPQSSWQYMAELYEMDPGLRTAQASCLYGLGRFEEVAANLRSYPQRGWSGWFANATVGSIAARLGRRSEAEEWLRVPIPWDGPRIQAR